MANFKCIFCNQEKEESLEHIIPYSIGNSKLTTKLVCKDCNNKMGATVDYVFIDNPIIKIKREELRLTGHSTHTPPQVLEKGFNPKDENDEIKIDKDGTPRLTPSKISNEDGISFKSDSEKNVKEMVQKHLARVGFSKEEIQKYKNIIEETPAENMKNVKFEFPFLIDDIILEFLKIGYEYACEKLGEKYYSDNIAEHLKSFINTRMSEKNVNLNQLDEEERKEFIKTKEEKLSNYNKFVKEGLGNIEWLQNLRKSHPNFHYLLPFKKDNELHLTILLFNGDISYDVLISNKADKYDQKNWEKSACFIDIKLDK